MYGRGNAGNLEDLGGHLVTLRLIGDEEDHRRAVESGQAQAHSFSGGFAITEIKEYNRPKERVLNVLLLGGKEFDSWKAEADDRLVQFARVNGCQAIEFACRMGLADKISQLGYRKHRILMRKQLDEQTIPQAA